MGLTLRDAGVVYAAGTDAATVALAGASLVLEPGDLQLVVGPTGSGKTTLLRLCAGLLRPTSGAVEVDGAGGDARRSFRGIVGLVFQNPERQFFAPSVLEDVAFGPRNLGATEAGARDAAADALAAVGLDASEFGDRLPFSLSGGEARRVAMAGVLAMRPRYLLLDEPTAGLDAPGRASVLSTIAAMREHAGLLVVTHDAEELLADATGVLALDAGRTAFSGTAERYLAWLAADERAELRAPEVVRAQLLARRRAGLEGPGEATLDVAQAASALLGLRGAAR